MIGCEIGAPPVAYLFLVMGETMGSRSKGFHALVQDQIVE
jgi:hypothetical protein